MSIILFFEFDVNIFREHNKNMKRILIISLIFMSMVSFFACNLGQESTKSPSSSTDEVKISSELVDKSATENTVRLMHFLKDTYGKKIISGQMDLTWKDSVDMAAKVYNDTGKYPALMGYDFMNYTSTASGNGTQQTEEAIAWWQKGGIVTFCWHWRDPSVSTGYPEFYLKSVDFKIPYDSETDKLVEGESLTQINNCLDKVAEELSKLQEAEVPVLWRPLHEAVGSNGNPWFWWGGSGAAAYKALWKHMFNYFTKDKNLHNLIWVCSAQDKDWYPGDEYVDIVGYDVYVQNYDSQISTYNECHNMTDDPDNNPKMVALTENGSIPSPDALQKDSAWWLYFMTWNDSDKTGTDESNFWEGEYHNTAEHKKEVYLSDYVLTLDELPDIKNYPLS